MEQISVFSVSLWENEFPDFDLKKQKFLNAVNEYRQENPEGESKYSVNGYQSPEFLHTKEDLRCLFEHICSVAEKASNQLNFSKNTVCITGSWVNFNENRQTIISPHNHEDIFTGVFYLNAPEKSGKLCLINPSINSLWEGKKLSEEKDKFTSEILKVEPKEGMILLWPSYVNHYVEPNNHDDVRISISFRVLNVPN